MDRKLNKIYSLSKRIPINKNSKIIIMSDCHRGIGNKSDNFLQNKNIYEEALTYYEKKGFTYIELGDGDEMWEVKKYEDIIKENFSAFKVIKKLHDKGKFIMIYGNHDLCKKNNQILKDTFYQYYNEFTGKKEELFQDLKVYESLILDYNNHEIFLVHGHQVDFLNSNLWYLSRFLVRNVWKYAEKIGIKDPTSAAKNHRVTTSVEKKLKNWSIKNNKILIAGHTHRPIYPKVGNSLYFNDGSCVHPNGITCLEIENGNITLVKWRYHVKGKNKTVIEREVLAGKEPIINFFK